MRPSGRPEDLFVSVSQLKTYLRCPRQYELHYVRGEEPEFKPTPLAFGSAFHEALAAYYSVLMAQGVPDLAAVIQVFVDAWDAEGDGDLPLQVLDADEDEDPNAILDKGVAMLTVFHEHAQKSPVVVEAVEMPFSVDLYDPATGEALEEKLVGAIDLVTIEDGHRVVVEHKTSAKKYTLDQLRFDNQPTAYQLAVRQLGMGEVGLRYQVITKTKTPAVQIEDVRRDEQDEADFLATAIGVLRAIDAGSFFPIRGWQCRSCPYATACSERRSR